MNEFKVKEFALLERVDEKTVRRWIAKGALEVRRTPGGGVRILDRRSRAFFVDLRTNADISGQPAT